ncbi:hypothetical protein BC829DRAFT_381904 [Chytridium lagenaria]|nr:hypothetical protein BC829DRAFT_381904 [Chytridium lagenaria]
MMSSKVHPLRADQPPLPLLSSSGSPQTHLVVLLPEARDRPSALPLFVKEMEEVGYLSSHVPRPCTAPHLAPAKDEATAFNFWSWIKSQRLREGWENPNYQSIPVNRLRLFFINKTNEDNFTVYMNRSEFRSSIVKIIFAILCIVVIILSHWFRISTPEERNVMIKCGFPLLITCSALAIGTCLVDIILMNVMSRSFIERRLHYFTVTAYFLTSTLIVFSSDYYTYQTATFFNFITPHWIILIVFGGAFTHMRFIHASCFTVANIAAPHLAVHFITPLFTYILTAAQASFCQRQTEVTLRQSMILASLISEILKIDPIALMTARLPLLVEELYKHSNEEVKNESSSFQTFLRNVLAKLFQNFEPRIESEFLEAQKLTYLRTIRFTGVAFVITVIIFPFMDSFTFCRNYPEWGPESLCSKYTLSIIMPLRLAGYPTAFFLIVLLSFARNLRTDYSQWLVSLINIVVCASLMFLVSFVDNFALNRVHEASTSGDPTPPVDDTRNLFLSYTFNVLFAAATGMRLRSSMFFMTGVVVVLSHPIIVKMYRPSFRVGMVPTLHLVVMFLAAFTLSRSAEHGQRRLFLLEKLLNVVKIGGEISGDEGVIRRV